MLVADESRIHFRPLEIDDLDTMHRWLNGDFVARWWPGWPTHEQVRAKYTPRITGEDPTRCFIIELENSAIGFIQCYCVIDDPHLRPLIDEPEHATGIDLFIGDRANARCGLGPRIIRKFLREFVFAPPETNTCIIDPAQNNAAAIRAYAKTGFHHFATINVRDELEPSYVMVLGREAFARDE
ncbi:MAG TPA: GNAT family N-acetyltransferase [Candidatus Binataceae bacterium]|nr:GNAT family N-acetyltransferase [Candidatus Binataceae bacterium]